jgi:hypothetical protein
MWAPGFGLGPFFMLHRLTVFQWQFVATAGSGSGGERFVGVPNLFAYPNLREELMTRYTWIALAGATAMSMTAPAAAQSAGSAGGQPATAQPTSNAPATAPAAANGDDPAAPATDAKSDTKAKTKAGADTKATCGTVIKAGPDQGQVINKCKSPDKAKTDSDMPPK